MATHSQQTDAGFDAALAHAARHQARRMEKQLAKAQPGAEPVHEARKAGKHLRAYLRLLEDAVSPRHQRHLRDALRPLSAARDMDVWGESLDTLADEASLSPAELHAVRVALGRRAQQQRRQWLTPAHLHAATDAGADAADAVAAAVPKHARMADLAPGLGRLYRRARRAMSGAARNPETFHSWRKQTKYLRYALDLFGEQPEHAALDRLGDLLGLEHDLLMLKAVITQLGDGSDRAGLLAAIEAHRARLQRQALALGHQVFVLPRKRFLASLAKPSAAAKTMPKSGHARL